MVVQQPNANPNDYLNPGPYVKEAEAYVAAAWDEDAINSPQNLIPLFFMVGNNSMIEAGGQRYTNPPLKSFTEYTIFVRYDIRNDMDPSNVSCTSCMLGIGYIFDMS